MPNQLDLLDADIERLRLAATILSAHDDDEWVRDFARAVTERTEVMQLRVMHLRGERTD